MNATHFIEQVRSGIYTVNFPILEIKNLERSKARTAESPSLISIAIWKIEIKEGFELIEGKIKSNTMPNCVYPLCQFNAVAGSEFCFNHSEHFCKKTTNVNASKKREYQRTYKGGH